MGSAKEEPGREASATAPGGERLRWKVRIRPTAFRRNAAVLDYLVRSAEWQELGGPHRHYQPRFTANHFHFATDRIAWHWLTAPGIRSRGASRAICELWDARARAPHVV